MWTSLLAMKTNRYRPTSDSCTRSTNANAVQSTPLFVVHRFTAPSNVNHLSDDAIEALLEPLHSLVAVDTVTRAEDALASAAAGDTLARTGHAAVEVHAVDTNRRVVLDSQVDVLADTEAEVAGLAEVALAKFILLDLKATLENFLRLGSTNGNVHSDLLVTANTEGSDSVASLACRLKISTHMDEQ
jgi:hypothetical protein